MPKPGTGSRGPLPQVLLQDLLQLGEADPPAPQLVAIAVLGEIGLAAEDLRPLAERLVERQVLEGVQRVVVDEDGDRPLLREQVRGVLDDLGELAEVPARTPEAEARASRRAAAASARGRSPVAIMKRLR